MPSPKIDQLHDLMCQTLRAAGGVDCESLLPQEQGKKIADVWFADEQVMVEVKSLGTDRNKTDSVRRRTSEILSKHAPWAVPKTKDTHFSVPMQSLPPATREKLLMHLGDRIKKEAIEANR